MSILLTLVICATVVAALSLQAVVSVVEALAERARQQDNAGRN